jgi:hypothetical protein
MPVREVSAIVHVQTLSHAREWLDKVTDTAPAWLDPILGSEDS